MTYQTFLPYLLQYYSSYKCSLRFLPNNREMDLDYLPGDFQILIVRTVGHEYIEEVEIIYDDTEEANIYMIMTWEMKRSDNIKTGDSSDPIYTGRFEGYDKISNSILKSKHQSKI